MPDTQIHPIGDAAAPAAYPIPASAELVLKMVRASFDGSGAASSFRPCLRIISDAGTIAGEAITDEVVAAGASADVTWFPRVAGSAGGSGGGGIQFDTDNQGGWLDITTNNEDANADGMNILDTTGGGIFMQSNSAPATAAASANVSFDGVDLRTYSPANDDTRLEMGSGGVALTGISNGVPWYIENDGTSGLQILMSGPLQIGGPHASGVTIGFFGATPVAQQAAPVTLADVIALLQAYGLSA